MRPQSRAPALSAVRRTAGWIFFMSCLLWNCRTCTCRDVHVQTRARGADCTSTQVKKHNIFLAGFEKNRTRASLRGKNTWTKARRIITLLDEDEQNQMDVRHGERAPNCGQGRAEEARASAMEAHLRQLLSADDFRPGSKKGPRDGLEHV